MYEFRAAGLRSLLCVLLWLVGIAPLTAQASFPATSDPSVCTTSPCYKYTTATPWPNTTAVRSTPMAACQEAAALATTLDANYSWSCVSATGGLSTYHTARKTTGAFFNAQTWPYTQSSTPPLPPVYTCPTNATLSGSQCTCNTGTKQVGTGTTSTCETVKACDWAAGLTMLMEGSVVLPKSNPTLCMQGCVFTASGGANGGLYWKAADTDTSPYVGEYSVTGLVGSSTVCTGAEGKDLTPGTAPTPDKPASAPNVPEVPCPPGQLPGTATYGNTTVTICTPAPVTQADKPKETVKKNAGTPEETTTEKEAETKCVGDQCTTTTKTTTKDANGVTTGVTINVETGSKNGICEKNPKDRICTGGIAGDCPENASSIGCMKVGSPEDGEVPSDEVNVGSITPDSMAGFNIGRTCPPDLTVELFGKTHHFEFKPLCDNAHMIKPIVMLLAAFGALSIVYVALVGGA